MTDLRAEIANQLNTHPPETDSKIMMELGESVWRRLLRRLEEIPLEDRQKVTDHLLDDPLARIAMHQQEVYECQEENRSLREQLKNACIKMRVWEDAHAKLAESIMERVG